MLHVAGEPGSAAPGRARRLWASARKPAWRLARNVLVIYLGVVLVLSLLQESLIFPGAATQGRPEVRVRPKAGQEMVTLRTADGTRFVALFGPALTADGRPHPGAASRPTLLDFYGNAMCLRDAAVDLEGFRRLGLNVLIVEYPGYGMSDGRPGERACFAAADAAYDHLLGRNDVDPRRIVPMGWSLGGAVAIDLAARRPVAGVAAFSTFTSMADAARFHYPWLPARLLLRHRFETERTIALVRRPVLLGHGTRDSIIPPGMADRLAAAAGGPVTRLRVEGADHNDFFAVGGPRILDALGHFVDGLPR